MSLRNLLCGILIVIVGILNVLLFLHSTATARSNSRTNGINSTVYYSTTNASTTQPQLQSLPPTQPATLIHPPTVSHPTTVTHIPTATHHPTDNQDTYNQTSEPDVQTCSWSSEISTNTTILDIVRSQSCGSESTPLHTDAQYFAYIPAGYQNSTAELQLLARVLEANPDIDVVGGHTIHNGELRMRCHHINLCHWTVLLNHQYTCSSQSLMKCDVTSNLFVARSQHLQKLRPWLGTLTEYDFFLQMKHNNATVVTETNVLLETGDDDPQICHSAAKEFASCYAATEIVVDETLEIDLCDTLTCDGKLAEHIIGSHWDGLGMTMPVFFYKSYVDALVFGTQFSEQYNVTYYLCCGQLLGLLKFHRVLPWDAGDVDINVDIESVGGCTAWLKIVRQWADDHNFKHPHTSGAGETCKHYGVYVVSPQTFVDDPFSLALVTFTAFPALPTTTMQVYDVGIRVPKQLYHTLHARYGTLLLKHTTHDYTTHVSCDSKHVHNCILQDDGSHHALDECIRHTSFWNYKPSVAN